MVRRQLGRELRRARERARRTLDDVALAQVASVSKVHRIEHGRTSVSPGDVRELCRLYCVGEDVAETLADLARATRNPDWWERHDTSAPSWFALYLRLEAVASEVWTFEPALVHGLFQTCDYARQVERRTSPDRDQELVERYVATRMARQAHILERESPMRIRLVLGEAALMTKVGTPDVMHDQREHLWELSRRQHIDVRILTFAAGPHPGPHGAFSVLSFPEEDDPPVAYVETYEAARYPESPAQIARYRRKFEQIWALAVPIEECTP